MKYVEQNLREGEILDFSKTELPHVCMGPSKRKNMPEWAAFNDQIFFRFFFYARSFFFFLGDYSFVFARIFCFC